MTRLRPLLVVDNEAFEPQPANNRRLDQSLRRLYHAINKDNPADPLLAAAEPRLCLKNIYNAQVRGNLIDIVRLTAKSHMPDDPFRAWHPRPQTEFTR